MKDYIELFRVRQWYKNVVIFLPIIFSQTLFMPQVFFKALIGFASLCLISSSFYIINDIRDKGNDQLNIEKKTRPITSGRIGVFYGGVLSAILFIFAVGLGFTLSKMFLLFVIGLFFTSIIYIFFLKQEIFMDIIIIAVNFVFRAVSGAYIITRDYSSFVMVSPWLILCTFFLSLFLSSAKRKSELIFLKEKAGQHKKVLDEYTIQLSNVLMVISTTLLIISYALYSFLSIYPKLIITLPIALYAILRYYFIVEAGSVIGRKPELLIKDKKLAFSLLAWFLAIIVIIYWKTILA